ncbi:hypothetical protein ACJBU6_07491 [Exserohilum turcicum]
MVFVCLVSRKYRPLCPSFSAIMAQFSDIPAELRNVIYGELLLKSQAHISLERFSNGNHLSLFAVSKQLHHETTSYFYQHNQITIDPMSPKTETATILPPIADRYLRFLRQLKIAAMVSEANSSTHQRLANTIASLATVGANFEDIHIAIQSTLSRLVTPMVDDSILGSNHPVTAALRLLLGSGVAKVVRLQLVQVWFAPLVAQNLKSQYGDRILFLDAEGVAQNARSVQKPWNGVYVGTHMTALGLDIEAVVDALSPSHGSPSSMPSSISSSVGSAFSSLDTFSVTEFELGCEDAKNEESKDESANDDSFFSGINIEEWDASTQVTEQHDLLGSEEMEVDDDVSDDEELEDVSQEDFDAIMGNMEDMANYEANQCDMTYMTNFAPELLLSRYHLGHLL